MMLDGSCYNSRLGRHRVVSFDTFFPPRGSAWLPPFGCCASPACAGSFDPPGGQRGGGSTDDPHRTPVKEILLVEDDDGHADLIIEVLQEIGIPHRVRRFKDGQSILDFILGRCATDGPPETGYVLILDIRIPKRTGIEVLERIRTQKALQNLPIIMLTTSDDPTEIASCFRLGCNAFITKPVDYDEFAAAVQSLLPLIDGIASPGQDDVPTGPERNNHAGHQAGAKPHGKPKQGGKA